MAAWAIPVHFPLLVASSRTRRVYCYERGRWCCHWFLVQWVFDSYVMSHVIQKKLEACLGKRPFRYWGCRYRSSEEDDDEKYRYRFLVYVEPNGTGLGPHDNTCLDLTEEDCSARHGSEVDADDCLMIPFMCCASFLTRAVPGWVLTVVKRGNMIIGDDELLDSLTEITTECGLDFSGSDDEGEEPRPLKHRV
ncbi:hypothetical protein EDB80DRAFT_691172 [Ilyonectria destructans]|nr:hypothetical protein EDB80DRAFT_691172 [Ilyonectria destructans]